MAKAFGAYQTINNEAAWIADTPANHPVIESIWASNLESNGFVACKLAALPNL